jgi:transcriptional regulator with GAF, ATPase, and Fis domain
LPHKGKLELKAPSVGQTSAAANEVIREKEWRERERANLLAALRAADFRISGKGGAAELLGINAGTLASRLKALGINRRDHLASRNQHS